jgi:hypothetical protein
MINHGPVDIVILAAGEPRFDGAALAELERQASLGTIRVLDAMLLFKDEEGNRASLNIEDLEPEAAAVFGFIETGTRGLFDSEDAGALFEAMAPGSAVVALAIEHAWAIALVNALYQSGVDVALNHRVPALVVDEAFASLGIEE